MVFLGGELPASVADCGAYPYVSGSPGTLVDVVGINSIAITGSPTTTEWRGDDKVLATTTDFSSLDLTLSIHQLHLASIAAVSGGTVTSTGTTPNQINKLERKSGDVVADYKLAGQTFSKDAAGGGTRLTLLRCQWAGGPDFSLADKAFADLSVKAKAIPNASDVIWDIEQFETYTALA